MDKSESIASPDSRLPSLNNVGKPRVIYIIPFVFKKTGPKVNTTLINRARELNPILDSYSSDHPSPSNEILKLLSDEDSEVYSDFYRNSSIYQRFYLGKPRAEYNFISLSMDVVITFHNNEFGNILLISNVDHEYSFASFMQLLKAFQENPQLKFWFTNQKVPLFAYSLVDLLSICYLKQKSDKSFYRPRPRLTFQLGDYYPLIVLYSSALKIIDLKEFIKRNAKNLYGLANIDFWGWKRTKSSDALGFLDVDLSRRVEYSFFITPSASLEIDSQTRMEQIKKWANDTQIDPEMLHLKLIFERVLDLEVLRIQHHLMTSLDLEITTQVASKKVSYRTVTGLRTLIADGLNDYYNIRSQNKGHVSGTDWITYGQQKMGIVRLHDNLHERIASLEIRHDVYVQSAGFQLTAALSLISIFLSATASNQIVDMIANIPYLRTFGFDSWKWLFSLAIFLAFIIFSGVVFIITTRLARSNSQ